MSRVAALIRRKGSTVSLYAPTPTDNADASPGQDTWTAVETGGRMWLQPMTDELAGRVWGTAAVVREQGFYAGTATLAPGQGVVVTAGRRTGSRFRIEALMDYDGSRAGAHQAVAVVQTDEAIP